MDSLPRNIRKRDSSSMPIVNYSVRIGWNTPPFRRIATNDLKHLECQKSSAKFGCSILDETSSIKILITRISSAVSSTVSSSPGQLLKSNKLADSYYSSSSVKYPPLTVQPITPNTFRALLDQLNPRSTQPSSARFADTVRTNTLESCFVPSTPRFGSNTPTCRARVPFRRSGMFSPPIKVSILESTRASRVKKRQEKRDAV